MLTLSRKTGQKILIGPDVELIIGKVQGNRVSLSFSAPASVKILRGELPKTRTAQDAPMGLDAHTDVADAHQEVVT